MTSRARCQILAIGFERCLGVYRRPLEKVDQTLADHPVEWKPRSLWVFSPSWGLTSNLNCMIAIVSLTQERLTICTAW
jgi:hypothetical protein